MHTHTHRLCAADRHASRTVARPLPLMLRGRIARLSPPAGSVLFIVSLYKMENERKDKSTLLAFACMRTFPSLLCACVCVCVCVCVISFRHPPLLTRSSSTPCLLETRVCAQGPPHHPLSSPLSIRWLSSVLQRCGPHASHAQTRRADEMCRGSRLVKDRIGETRHLQRLAHDLGG